MAGNLKIYPLAPGAKRRVHLEDQGQDFLWLDIRDDKILDAGPFQGWLWKDKLINPNGVKVGKPVPIYMRDHWTTIKYPVTRIEAA